LLQEAWENKHLYVKQMSSLFVIVQGFGYSMLYDRNGRIYISLEPYYANKVRGGERGGECQAA
jgi:hypothetical protein